jgi:DNA-binding GntR family transcriptional regulator
LKHTLDIDRPDKREIGPTDQIRQGIELAIHEHRLAPGTRLAEEELADIYGVSRVKVRDALQALAHHRLVTIRPNRGAIVAQPDAREAREGLETRELLEPRMAHKAALNSRAEDITALRAHLEEEKAALLDMNHGRALRLSGKFHQDVARIADQDTIASIIDVLVARSALVIALYWRKETARCDNNCHASLVDALEAGDADRAERVMHAHLEDIRASLDIDDRPRPAQSLRDALLGEP